MRKIIRTALFVAASLYVAQLVISGFDFGSDFQKTFLLVTLAFSILYLFLRPLLALISLPNRGVMYFFFLFLTSAIMFYILTLVLSDFAFKQTTLMGINLFDHQLPAKELSPIMSLVFSGLATSLVYLFLEGLCCDKK